MKKGCGCLLWFFLIVVVLAAIGKLFGKPAEPSRSVKTTVKQTVTAVPTRKTESESNNRQTASPAVTEIISDTTLIKETDKPAEQETRADLLPEEKNPELREEKSRSGDEPQSATIAEEKHPEFIFEENRNLKGRGYVDISGFEPLYTGISGFAVVSPDDEINTTDLPWTIPVYQRNGENWEKTGMIEHKTQVGVVSQELKKKNGKEYQGYLEVVLTDTLEKAYIKASNFVTTPYWELPVTSALEKGYFLAVYTKDKKHIPINEFGKKTGLDDGTIILVPMQGTHYKHSADYLNYPIPGYVYREENSGKEPVTLFFHSADLSISY